MRWKKPIKICAANDIPEKVPITLLLSPTDDEYVYMLASYIKNEGEKAGYRVNFVDSKNSAELQLNEVKAAQKNGEKAVILNPVNPNDAKRILDAAGDMKVIFVSRAPADLTLLNQNAIYVSSDQNIAGKLQGEFLADYFKNKDQKDIKYLLLQGPPDLDITKQRTESALKALADNGINATPAAPPIIGNFMRSEAQYKIYPVLASGVEFDTIISNNDDMALGAIDVLETLRMNPSKTPIVGINATYSAFRAIREGKLAMTVYTNAKEQSKTAITALTNMLNNKPFYEGLDYSVSPDNPYIVYIPYEPVTKYNIPKDLEYTPQ